MDVYNIVAEQELELRKALLIQQLLRPTYNRSSSGSGHIH